MGCWVVRPAGAADAPASPAATRPVRPAVYGGPTVADVPSLVNDLLGEDAAARSIAAAKLKNLPPDGLGAIRAALRDPRLSPEAEVALKKAERFAVSYDKLAHRIESYNDWNLRTGREAYEHVAKKDPKWEAAAGEGVRQFFSVPRGPKCAQLLKQAVDAGCDDPFVTYLCARALTKDDDNAPTEEVGTLLARAAKGMPASDYPASRKLTAMLRCYDANRDKALTSADECLKLFEAALREPGLPPQFPEDWMKTFPALMADANGKEDGPKKLFGAYAAALPDAADPLRLKGEFYIKYAWEARGHGFANTVTPEGWRLFADRLAVASEALEAAWKADPTDARTAAAMIEAKLGQGDAGGGIAEMEKWFGRAAAADPTAYDAYDRKFVYLMPRWYGSPEELVRFGHECLALDSWETPAVSYLLVNAHEEVARWTNAGPAYWRRADVWADVQSVYERVLKVFPGNQAARGHYTSIALQAGQWDVALAQFAVLGDHPDAEGLHSFGGTMARYNYAREFAAAAKAGRAPPSPPPGPVRPGE